MSELFKSTHCDRCGMAFEGGMSRIMSKMNTDIICNKCKKEEIKHPKYKIACDAELDALRAGDRNYGGLFYGQKYPFE